MGPQNARGRKRSIPGAYTFRPGLLFQSPTPTMHASYHPQFCSSVCCKRKVRKGILGVPRRAERQVLVFGRFAEELPSDDSDDFDFNPSKDEESASPACTLPGWFLIQ